MKRRTCLQALATATTMPMLAKAQDRYPSRATTVLVPLAAGSDTDTVARLLTQSLANELKQPFVVDNKPGAGGQIALSALAAAKPDGYTVGVTFQAASVIVPQIRKTPPYHPVNDFTYVARIATTCNVLAVRADSPVRSIQDLVARAKEKPSAMSYGSWGIGSGGHLAGELVNLNMGIKTVHVPYKGTPEALRGLLGGEIDYAFFGIGLGSTQAKAGQLRVLAMTGPERMQIMPEIPTLRESGVAFSHDGWFAVVGPAGMPAEVRARLEETITRIVRSADFSQKLASLGMAPSPLTAVEMTGQVQREFAVWGDWLRQLNWPKE